MGADRNLGRKQAANGSRVCVGVTMLCLLRPSRHHAARAPRPGPRPPTPLPSPVEGARASRDSSPPPSKVDLRSLRRQRASPRPSSPSQARQEHLARRKEAAAAPQAPHSRAPLGRSSEAFAASAGGVSCQDAQARGAQNPSDAGERVGAWCRVGLGAALLPPAPCRPQLQSARPARSAGRSNAAMGRPAWCAAAVRPPSHGRWSLSSRAPLLRHRRSPASWAPERRRC